MTGPAARPVQTASDAGCRRCAACGNVQGPQLNACIDCGAGLSDAEAHRAAARVPFVWALGLASGCVVLLALERWL